MVDVIQFRNVVTDPWSILQSIEIPLLLIKGSELSWLPVDNPEKHNFWNISGPNPAMEHSDSIQERMELWQSVLEDDKST